MSTWHHRDGTKSTYQNPPTTRQLWLNPQGQALWADRPYPYVSTASILSVAGTIRMEGEMIRAGWRRILTPQQPIEQGARP